MTQTVEAREHSSRATNTVDCAVVGGGPAGLAGAMRWRAQVARA